MRDAWRLFAVVSIVGLSANCGGDGITGPSPGPLAGTGGTFQVISPIATPRSQGFIGRFDAELVAGVGVGSPAAPAAPSNLTASVSGTTVTISWTAGGGGQTSYVIEAGSSPGAADFANFDTKSAATFFFAPLVPNGTYYVRVRARNADGTSGPSNEVTIVVTGGGGPCTAPPGAPTNFTASVSGNTVTVSWQAPAGIQVSGAANAATSYILEAGSTVGASNLFNSDIGNNTSLTATAPNGNYFARARSRNACGTSGPSNEANFSVSGGAVNLSGTWSGPNPSDPPDGIVTVTFQHSGNQLTGSTVGYPGSFNLTQTASSATTRTFSGTFTITEAGACNPSVKNGSMVVNITFNTMTGAFIGPNTDCHQETNFFSLTKQP